MSGEGAFISGRYATPVAAERGLPAGAVVATGMRREGRWCVGLLGGGFELAALAPEQARALAAQLIETVEAMERWR